MSLEVELKFRIDDPVALHRRLDELGVRFSAPVTQADHYFNHPSRDFATTDEAVRVRSVGENNFITYKGPKLDRTVKTRREIELPLGDGVSTADGFAELLTTLGFRSTAVVRKLRTPGTLDWNGVHYEICWDETTGIGTFLEIELVVDPERADEARTQILALQAALGLTTVERRSYLAMLLGRGT